MEENLKNIVNIALELTKAAGCNATRAGAEISVQSSFSVRNNTLDRLQSSTGSTLFIQLFIDGRFGFYSTNRTEIDELKDDTWGSPLTGDHEGYPLSGDTEA